MKNLYFRLYLLCSVTVYQHLPPDCTLHSWKVARTLGKSGRERRARLTDLRTSYGKLYTGVPWSGGAGDTDPGHQAQGPLRAWR